MARRPRGDRVARRHGAEPEIWGEGGNLQWTPAPGFAAWLAPRLAAADLVHAHMFGAWWAAALAAPADTPLVASEHVQSLWPDRPYTAEMLEALERVGVFFAHGPGARETACSRMALLSNGCARASRPSWGRATVRTPGLPQPSHRLRRPPACRQGPRHPARGARAAARSAPGADPRRGRPAPDSRGPSPHARPRGARELPRLGARSGAYIAGATVLALPSRDESFSQTAIIGLAHGVPVIGDGRRRLPGDARRRPRGPRTARGFGALAAALDVVLNHALPRPQPLRHFTDQYEPARVADVDERTYRDLLAPQPAAVPVGA